MKSLRSATEIAMLLGIFMVTCSSCNKGGVTQPTFQSAFQEWQSHNLHDYMIDQNRTCYCVYGGQLMRVVVRADTVGSVTKISDSTMITSPYYLSIDSLFGIIRNSKGDSLVVRYNADYGYREYLDVNPQLHPVDGGVLYETSNLHVP